MSESLFAIYRRDTKQWLDHYNQWGIAPRIFENEQQAKRTVAGIKGKALAWREQPYEEYGNYVEIKEVFLVVSQGKRTSVRNVTIEVGVLECDRQTHEEIGDEVLQILGLGSPDDPFYSACVLSVEALPDEG